MPKRRKKTRKQKLARRAQKQRNDPGYEEFRQAVLKRDKHTCQMPGCGNRNRKWLQVHHIVPYSKAVSIRTCPDNGITLCYGCHKSISKKESHYSKVFLMIVRKNKENG